MATQAEFDRIGNYAVLYNPDQNIERSKATRTVDMQVLALGYSRTGTLSMQKALSILGYQNPYHFSSFLGNVRDCDIWLHLIGSKFDGVGPPVTKADFDGLLGHCGPGGARNFELDPVMEHFLGNSFNPVLPMLAKFDPSFLGRVVGVGTAGVDKQVGSAKTLQAARARSPEEYRKHYALVRSLKKENILEFQLADGWEPLCEFLGKPVPKEPFPHVNDSVANTQAFKEIALKGLKRAAANIAMSAVPAVVVAFFLFNPALRRRYLPF